MRITSRAQIDELTARAASSLRLRANLDLHPTFEDPVQRFLNALEPGTYVRPHRHGPGRWELFLPLSGRAAVLLFDDAGGVRQRAEISADGPSVVVEVEPGAWHTVVSLEQGTVLFELKQGPYVPADAKAFAAWAPPEGEGGGAAFELWSRGALPGDRF